MRLLVPFQIIAIASFPARLRFWVIAALLAEIYFVVGKASLMFASLHPSASPVWPPTGLALAALLLLGKHYWPAIFVGAFFVNVTTEGSIAATALIAAGNTLEAVAGFLLVQRFAGRDRAFEAVNGVLAFVLLAVLLCPVISASFGALSLALDGSLARDAVVFVWGTWWVGDAVGSIVVTPLIVLWCTRRSAFRGVGGVAEAFAIILLVALTGFFVFMPTGLPLLSLCFLPLLWTALRFTPRDTALCAACMSTLAIAATVRGWGPFATTSENASLLLLQAFIAVYAFVGLLLSAAILERRIAESSLERCVWERTEELERLRNLDRIHLEFLRNTVDQLSVAMITTNEQLKVHSINERFRSLFRLRNTTAPMQSLSDVFADIRLVFHEPHETIDGLLQILSERRQRTGHELRLADGAAIVCDYTPIFVDGVHRGHIFVFRESQNVL